MKEGTSFNQNNFKTYEKVKSLLICSSPVFGRSDFLLLVVRKSRGQRGARREGKKEEGKEEFIFAFFLPPSPSTVTSPSVGVLGVQY